MYIFLKWRAKNQFYIFTILQFAAEQMQQAVVFPNYLNHSNNVIPSSLLVPPPPSSIQLLSDIGGARLVLTENKRKQQNSLPIVKIEAECSNSPTAIISKENFLLFFALRKKLQNERSNS